MVARPELEKAKYEVAVGNRALVDLGLAVGVRKSMGHTSIRVPGDPNAFVVKGRGYRLDVLSRMRPEDMVVCDLDGNWLDGPPYSSQCTEVKIHSCIYRARPEVVSVTHVHPDYAVLLSVLGAPIRPMAMEGATAVLAPIPVFPQTKMIISDAEGSSMARLLADGAAILLLGHGAVTASTISVEESVIAMAHLEHQARLNYLAMCAEGRGYSSIAHDLAASVDRWNLDDAPHLRARRDLLEIASVNESGLWADIRSTIDSNW